MAGSPERQLLAAVARRYYLDDRSKVQIGQEIGVSRFKVARMLQEARETGVVRIEIEPQAGIEADLSDAVRERLGLRRAVVVDVPEDAPDDERRRAIARLAAAVLDQTLTTKDVLGLSSSRSVAALVAELRSLPPVPVVQLCGALQLHDAETTSIDLVRDAARLGGGTAHQFYAPLVASDPTSAHALRRQANVADAFSLVSDVTIAVVGVGGWSAHESTLYDLATEAEHVALREAGVVGEIAGAFIDRDGHAVDAGMSQRMITLAHDQLRSIDHLIGLAMGSARADIIRASVAGGFVTSLVCDRALARALLQ